MISYTRTTNLMGLFVSLSLCDHNVVPFSIDFLVSRTLPFSYLGVEPTVSGNFRSTYVKSNIVLSISLLCKLMIILISKTPPL